MADVGNGAGLGRCLYFGGCVVDRCRAMSGRVAITARRTAVLMFVVISNIDI